LLAGGTLFAARRSFSFKLGKMRLAKELLKDGLVNAPSKLSRVLVLSLGIVLLAFFGVNSSETGVFYIAMMISMAAGGFALNMAYMVLPASSESNVDLSSGSLRLGLTFTAPIIAALLTAPAAVLSVIGPEYAAQGIVLLILSVYRFSKCYFKAQQLGQVERTDIDRVHSIVSVLCVLLCSGARVWHYWGGLCYDDRVCLLCNTCSDPV
jgi:O-antigen/teichoic acid export membrane protein